MPKNFKIIVPQAIEPPISAAPYAEHPPEGEDALLPVLEPAEGIVELVEEPKKPRRRNELADLFEVPHESDNDMDTTDLLEGPGDDELG